MWPKQCGNGISKRVCWAHAVTLFLCCYVKSAASHTWLFTNGRSAMQSSTAKPYKVRGDTHGGKGTHAQFGPNQHMIVRWASSHNNTFTLVRVVCLSRHGCRPHYTCCCCVAPHFVGLRRPITHPHLILLLSRPIPAMHHTKCRHLTNHTYVQHAPFISHPLAPRRWWRELTANGFSTRTTTNSWTTTLIQHRQVPTKQSQNHDTMALHRNALTGIPRPTVHALVATVSKTFSSKRSIPLPPNVS
jgi:hypothetical protein